jgi:hypothetical protein
MAIYNTLVNKTKAFRLYSNKSLSNLDLDNSRGEGFSTCDTASKLTIIVVCISGTLVIYTKV